MTQPPDYGQTPPPSDGGGYGGYGATPPPPPPPAGPLGGDNYSVGDALSYGWRKFTQNAGTLIAIGLLLFITVIAISLILQFGLPQGDSQVASQVMSALSGAISWVVQTAIGALIVRAALDITEGRPLEFGSLFGRIPWGKVIVLSLLVGVIVFIGFVLCFIPGIIAAFLLSYASYFLLDDNVEPVEAIKASFALVKNNVGSALVWAILAFFVGLVGLCFCGVGYLVTYPIALIGTAYTYKKLSGKPIAA